MGLPIALKLLAAGFSVSGHRRGELPNEFLDAGGHASPTPADLADISEIVLTLLPSRAALEQVAAGTRGLGETRRSGGVWLEMSTVDPAAKATAGALLGQRGWAMLDCPISGAPAQLTDGTAVLLSSGSVHAHQAAEPVLRAISPRVYRVGPFGYGMRAKYVAHVLLAGHTLVAAEALTLARRVGLDPVDVLSIFSGTIVSSHVLEQRGPQALTILDVESTAACSAFARALMGARELVESTGSAAPVLSAAIEELERASAGRRDDFLGTLELLLAPPRAVAT